MKTFAEWLKKRELAEDFGVTGGLSYGAEGVPPTSNATQPVVNPTQPRLIGVPPQLVQGLQRTGPAAQGILNRAQTDLRMRKVPDLSTALKAALGDYQASIRTGVNASNWSAPTAGTL